MFLDTCWDAVIPEVRCAGTRMCLYQIQTAVSVDKSSMRFLLTVKQYCHCFRQCCALKFDFGIFRNSFLVSYHLFFVLFNKAQ